MRYSGITLPKPPRVEELAGRQKRREQAEREAAALERREQRLSRITLCVQIILVAGVLTLSTLLAAM